MSSRVIGNAQASIREQDRRVRAELVVTLENTGVELEGKQNRVVARWTHKPKFRRVVTVTRTYLIVRVPASGAAAQIWRWVNYGTKGPYPIFAKNAPKLRFQLAYQPKTSPVAKVNTGGGEATGPWVTTDMVWHPGVAARKFTQEFAKDIRPFFRVEVRSAFRRGLRR